MPNLSFTTQGSYASQISLLHTNDPRTSAFYRVHPIPSNVAATQQLNSQGFFPTGSQPVDFSNVNYPADIRMKLKTGPNAPAYCARYNDNSSLRPTCNSCCPGMTATPWDKILDRSGCCGLTGENMSAPSVNDGGLGQICVNQSRHDLVPSTNCANSVKEIISRSHCALPQKSQLPFPYSLEEEAFWSAQSGGAKKTPLFSPVKSQKPMSSPAVQKANDINVGEAVKAHTEAINAANQTQATATEMSKEAVKNAVPGKLGNAVEEVKRAQSLADAARAAKLLAAKASGAVAVAMTASKNNESSMSVLEAAKQVVKSSQGSIDQSTLVAQKSPAASKVLGGYAWHQH